MNEAKLKQYLYEHPELLDDAFQGSLYEADRWAEENARSAEEIIALAKAKHPEIPAEKWADFEKAAAKQRKSERKAPIVHIRWWQVAVAAAIILVLTFTLVPPARAWAESVIRYIVTVFDGGVDIHQEGEIITHWTPSPEELNPTIENNSEHNYFSATYPNVAAFTEETGYKPVLIISDAFTMTNIEYQSIKNAFDSLCITYRYNEITVYVWQTWGNERGESLFADENDVLIRTTALGGKEVIGYEDKSEGCTLEIILDESNMTIMYFGNLDYQEILDALQYS